MDQLLATTLRALMRRKDWNLYLPVVTADMFANSTASAVYAMIGTLHGEAARNVTPARLRLGIQAHLPKKRHSAILDAVESLEEVTKDELADADLAIRAYAARHKANKAAKYIATSVGSPTFDFNIPAQLCAEAALVSQGKLQERVDIRDAGLPGDDNMVRKPIPLGLSAELDASLRGGVAAGELLLFLAPPKRGKTSYLYRVAANAAIGGASVLAFTLEIAQYKGWLRFDQCLTGLTTPELMVSRNVVEARRSALGGHFWLMDYCSQPLTPAAIQAEGEMILADGLPLDYIMIDYMEIMAAISSTKGKMRYEALGEMVIACRRVANHLGVPIISAWQIKREGSQKELFTTADISECWDAVKHADILLGLNQTPHEQVNGVMRVKVMEQRESTARPVIHLQSDMDRMNIGPFTHIMEDQYDGDGPMDGGDRPRTGVYGPRTS